MAELNMDLDEPPVIVQKAKHKGMPKTVRIVLEENDNIPPTGLFMGLNGKSYMLRPGEEADVPVGLVGILDNAVMETAIRDPQTQQVIGYRKRLRYPYRRVQA